MKRSNDYGPQPPIDNYKKPRFSPQPPYGYPLGASPPAGFTQNNADIYQQFGSMGRYMSVLSGMGGMAGMAGIPSQQHNQSGGQGMPAFQGMAPNQFQHGVQFPQNGYSAQYPAVHFAGNQNFAGNQGFNHTMRTVYLGNLPSLTTYEDVINLVRGGALEQVKILEEKNCAFITFVEASAAHTFHLECQNKRPHLQTSELRVGWGKHTPIPPAILAAVQGGASRNVFLGNIDESVTDTVLHQEFGRFGPIDQVKILSDKRIAFVHMASIVAAMKAVQNLPNEQRWATRRVNYGKDRCAYQAKGPGSTRPSPPTTPGGLVYAGATNFGHGMGVGYGMGFTDPFSGMNGGATNRTVYLGSIHPDVTTKDLCDVIRGGILQNIKYMPDKNIAFVTFIDPSAAVSFYNRGNYEGLVLKGKRLKVGWGKPSALPPAVASAVQSGASRNVYIGAIDESISEDRLRKDFSEYGDIELINIIADKNIGFVNFVDLTSAVKAVEALKSDESKGYGQYRINFGKDRCGNPPRPPRESAAQRAAAVAAAAENGAMGVDAFGAGGMVQHVDSMSSMDESEHLAGLLGNNTNYL